MLRIYGDVQAMQGEVRGLYERVRTHDSKLADQLRRAAQSVVLNTAEGRGNVGGNARLRFSTACGSAKEVRAALGVASDWGYVDARRVARIDGELDEVCAMSWKLSGR